MVLCRPVDLDTFSMVTAMQYPTDVDVQRRWIWLHIKSKSDLPVCILLETQISSCVM